MLAYLYFNIKKPDNYLKKVSNKNLKSIKQSADEWFNKEYGKDF
jgi:hypothetical protein